MTAAQEQAIVTGLINALAYVVTIDASQVALSFPSGDTSLVDVLMTFTNPDDAAAVAWAARSTTFDTNIEEQLNAKVSLSDLPRMTTILLVPPAVPPAPPLPPVPPFQPPFPPPKAPAIQADLDEQIGDNVATGSSDDGGGGLSAGAAVAVAIACLFACLCILAAAYAFVMLRRYKQTNLVIKRTHNSAPETAHAVPARFEATSIAIVQEARRVDAAIQDRIPANSQGGNAADPASQTESAQQDSTSGPTIDVVIPQDAIVTGDSPRDVKAGDANQFRDRLPEMRT